MTCFSLPLVNVWSFYPAALCRGQDEQQWFGCCFQRGSTPNFLHVILTTEISVYYQVLLLAVMLGFMYRRNQTLAVIVILDVFCRRLLPPLITGSPLSRLSLFDWCGKR
ncbi:hypothetical protein ILYODFUR_011881 [Ilyodon furcidens]|uniref:Uncharacterized protein n=1 Tax=Ilyodon furcidens TaxID=33524 RepID=A0ABV0TWQ0_9TELE